MARSAWPREQRHLAATQRLLHRRHATQHLPFAQPILGEVLVVGDDLHRQPLPRQAVEGGKAQVAMLSALIASAMRSPSRVPPVELGASSCSSRSGPLTTTSAASYA
jgi:hypothetical protein